MLVCRMYWFIKTSLGGIIRMKRTVSISLLALSLIAFSAAVRAEEAGEIMQAKDCAAMCAVYDKKVGGMETLINEHERMKVDSGWLKRINFNASAMAEMQTHCDAIILKAKALKEELKSMSEWCKKRS